MDGLRLFQPLATGVGPTSFAAQGLGVEEICVEGFVPQEGIGGTLCASVRPPHWDKAATRSGSSIRWLEKAAPALASSKELRGWCAVGGLPSSSSLDSSSPNSEGLTRRIGRGASGFLLEDTSEGRRLEGGALLAWLADTKAGVDVEARPHVGCAEL